MSTKKTGILVALLVLFSTLHSTAQTIQQSPVRISELITAIADSLSRYYIFPEKAEKISVYLQGKAKSGAYDSLLKTPQKLAQQIATDIGSAHYDPHLRISFDPDFNPQIAFNPTAEQKEFVKKYWKENNYSYKKLELLPGNIGYLSFNLFVEDIEAAKPTIKAALTFLGNAEAIIIDLRENMGGNPKMVSQVESYFFPVKTAMNHLIDRTAGDTVFMFADPSKTDGLYLPAPVYILTSNHTFSGAEDFSYGMQVAKRAVIVGETSGGGAHPQKPFAVSQGFVMYIPFARSLNPVTQKDWEGTGVIPDIKTTAANALIKAQELIFKNNISGTTDQNKKNKNQYYLNALSVHTEKKALPVNQLMSYTGTYGGLVIYSKQGKLYCKNNNNGGGITRLEHLNGNLFILDQEAQVEFIKKSQQQVTGIKIWVSDGSVFEENKL